MKTTSTILKQDFEFRAVHIGVFVSDSLWQHDKWSIFINGETFEYHTGLGHRKPGYRAEEFARLMNTNWRKTKKVLSSVNSKIAAVSRISPPYIDDVLFSLVIDASSGNKSFDNFCEELGYSNDSISDFKTYQDCMKTTKSLQKIGVNLEKAIEAFEDY